LIRQGFSRAIIFDAVVMFFKILILIKIKVKNMKEHCGKNERGGSAVYGLGFIGAAIWFISQATGFWMGVLGFLKAIVWPAFLVYEAFKHLAM
jgi:hypothetical protein